MKLGFLVELILNMQKNIKINLGDFLLKIIDLFQKNGDYFYHYVIKSCI